MQLIFLERILVIPKFFSIWESTSSAQGESMLGFSLQMSFQFLTQLIVKFIYFFNFILYLLKFFIKYSKSDHVIFFLCNKIQFKITFFINKFDFFIWFQMKFILITRKCFCFRNRSLWTKQSLFPWTRRSCE